MEVAVTGSSGLIGGALVTALRLDGHQVRRVVRTEPAPGEPAVQWDPARGVIDADALAGVDAVVHLAGAGIGDKRWTAERKREILDSRTQGTRLLATTLAGLDPRPSVLVSASGINVYGESGDAVLTEESPRGEGFLADVVEAWEAAADPAREAGIRVAHVRSGIVLSADGGALAKTLPLFKFGLGGRLGSGRQWWSWVSIDDEVAAIRWLFDHDVAGPVNVTAPNPVTNAEYTKVLGRVLRRPAVIPVPRFAPMLLLGRELVDELLFTSLRVRPAVLEGEGFTFSFPDLEGALRAALDRPAA